MDEKSYKDYIEEVDLQRYLLVIKRRWLPASIVFLGSLGIATVAAVNGSSVYESSGKLLLQQDRSTSLTGVGTELGGLQSLNPSSATDSPLVTQAGIVTSGPVLEKAIASLQLEDADGNPVKLETVKNNLVVEPIQGADILQISYQSPDPKLAAALVNAVMESYVATNISMNRSQAAEARKFIQAQLPQAKAEMQRSAEEMRQFKAQNQVIILDDEKSAAVSAIAELNSQIDQLQAQAVGLGRRSGELRQQLGMSISSALQSSNLSQATGVQQALEELQQAQAELSQKETLYRPDHPVIRQLQRQVLAAQTLLKERVARFVNSSVEVPLGHLQMSDINRDLTSSLVQVEAERLNLMGQAEILMNTREAYLEQSEAFPALEKAQLELDQQLSTAKLNYETLLVRLQEAQLAESQTVGTARIIESARMADEPISTSNLKYLLAGGAVGLLLAVAVSFVLDLIDKSVKTVKDAEALLGYTLVGLIPKFEQPGETGSGDLILESANWTTKVQNRIISPRIVPLNQTQPLITASYQMLQANLKFISSDRACRTIVITSAVPGEGKSEICANLAATIAQAGKRVLLVDADMRSPSQHHLWNVINHVGLSHVLVGEGRLKDALKPVAKNLVLLTAGVVPPNPLALLDSERMVKLTQEFADSCDYVLFDSPCLVGNADAAVVGKAADGVLLVVRPRHVDSASVLSAKSLLKRSGVSVLGMIANGVDVRNEHDDYVSHIKAGVYGSKGTAESDRLTTK